MIWWSGFDVPWSQTQVSSSLLLHYLHIFLDTVKDIIIRLSRRLIDVHWFITIVRLNADPLSTDTGKTSTISTLFYNQNANLFVLFQNKKIFKTESSLVMTKHYPTIINFLVWKLFNPSGRLPMNSFPVSNTMKKNKWSETV